MTSLCQNYYSHIFSIENWKQERLLKALITENEKYRKSGYKMVLPLSLKYDKNFWWEDDVNVEHIRLHHHRLKDPDVQQADTQKCFAIEREARIENEKLLTKDTYKTVDCKKLESDYVICKQDLTNVPLNLMANEEFEIDWLNRIDDGKTLKKFRTYTAISTICQNRHSHVVSIGSLAEEQHLTEAVLRELALRKSSTKSMLILGLRYVDGRLKWDDNTNTDYIQAAFKKQRLNYKNSDCYALVRDAATNNGKGYYVNVKCADIAAEELVCEMEDNSNNYTPFNGEKLIEIEYDDFGLYERLGIRFS
uniref:C-type lectin domain-containing protein n=1 Tax=Syphacia muris TaxID=451379 RepID=A0A0N5AGD2_9BILA